MSRRKRKRDDAILPAGAQAEQRVPRRLRVGGELHGELVALVRELRDPRVVDVHVTRVEMTDDLQLAKVYVRHAGLVAGDTSAEARLMAGLKAAQSRLRRQIGQALTLRYTPDLRFYYDSGFEAAQRVGAILDEIAAEAAAAASPAAPDDDADA